ncbi:MAG: LPS-assembly protein LptD, partial [Variovorax sp.]
VRINRAGNLFSGPELELKLDRFEGFFTTPSYRFLANGGNGRAERVDFLDDKHMVAHRVTYTTCERDDEATWKPAWVMTASRVDFDLDEEVGVASNAVIRFKEVPILAFPRFSFPLSDKRKSGLLPPTFNIGSIDGFTIKQPYYFNIAPNRDATFSPEIMAKRGLNLGGEYRYLDPRYSGVLRATYLPDDKLRNRDRWSYNLVHNALIDTGIDAIGDLNLSLNLNRVSDNDYWRDFPINNASVSQRLLPQDATLSWNKGYFSSAIRAVKYQTLQDISSPIVPPYDRLPQITAAYTRVDAPLLGLGNGFDWSIEGDYTRFHADSTLTGQPNADRAFTKLQIARPWLSSY